jgi:iduronate 2-sulfatase
MTVGGAWLFRLACISSPDVCHSYQIYCLFCAANHTAIVLQNFELGVRVPLIIRTPWLPKSIGKKTSALAEAVDLFPTFVAVSGLGAAVQLPKTQELQGFSLLPILEDPPSTGVGLRQYAFSQFAKGMQHSKELGKAVPWNTCTKCNRSTDIAYMGYSIRDDRWRFTQWIAWNGTTLRPLWNGTAEFDAQELYDHHGDFGASFDNATATVNLAAEPQYAGVVARLAAALRAQFQGDHEPPQQ